MYRAPTSPDGSLAAFYQKDYSEGFTTDLPDDEMLARLLDTGFSHSEKSYTVYIAVLKALAVRDGARVLDFGCSWGYGSWQLGKAGFEVDAFEISRPRRAYAQAKLGVRTLDSLDEARGPYDVFFSSHVLEHVPAPASVLSQASRILRPGGLFVAFTPNGSSARRDHDHETWNRAWGYVHPTLLDDVYYEHAFASRCQLHASSPYDLAAIARFENGASPERPLKLDLRGDELLFAARV